MAQKLKIPQETVKSKFDNLLEDTEVFKYFMEDMGMKNPHKAGTPEYLSWQLNNFDFNFPGRIAVKQLGKSALPEQIAEYLKRAWDPNTKEVGFDQLNKMIKAFKNEGYDEADLSPYLSALQGWTTGSHRKIREAIEFPNEPWSAKLNMSANALKELLNSATPTNLPLFRNSKLVEIPETVGEEFYHPALSFSTSRHFAMPSEIKTGLPSNSGYGMVQLSPGAKTLRLSPASYYGDEFEHLVGGTFKVLDTRPLGKTGGRYARIQQIDSNLR